MIARAPSSTAAGKQAAIVASGGQTGKFQLAPEFERQAIQVKIRLFGFLKIVEIASMPGVSDATLQRD